jgi:hypothetical protein
MRRFALAFLGTVLAVRAASAQCISVTSLCACNGASVIVEGRVEKVAGPRSTLRLGTVHRRPTQPGEAPPDESWISEQLVVPRASEDVVGGNVYVFSPTSRRSRSDDGSVTCSSDGPPLRLETAAFVELAFAGDCMERTRALGVVEPPCNDTGGCAGAAGSIAAGMVALAWALSGRRRGGRQGGARHSQHATGRPR